MAGDDEAERPHLALFGAGSVQGYVFGSNRLKENAGASYLTWKAMEDWRACALFVGGGNAACEFPGKREARARIAAWSRRWLESAPGLRLTAALAPVTSGLRAAFRVAQAALAKAENAPPWGADLGALPVVRNCPTTGGPANIWDRDEGEWLSAEAKRKREAFDAAEKRLAKELKLDPRYVFPREFADLGTREDASQIAIVHADGNGIGEELSNIAQPRADDTDEQFRQDIRTFSETIAGIASRAFQATLADLAGVLPKLEQDKELDLAEEPPRSEKQPQKRRFFPVRPIVFGGDDLTFVCHGKLGLALAARYLKHFEAEAMAAGKAYTACAGVLVMPQKFPFARGYELAEQLCALAKRKRRENGSKGSWLDFHVLLEGSSGSVERARETEYRRGLGRPYRLDAGGLKETQWSTFEAVWAGFRGKNWARNRAKRLFQAYARGDEVANDLLAAYASRKVKPPFEGRAFDAVNFDALEMLDFHLQPWPEKEGVAIDGGVAH
jgi:hypothetical protein